MRAAPADQDGRNKRSTVTFLMVVASFGSRQLMETDPRQTLWWLGVFCALGSLAIFAYFLKLLKGSAQRPSGGDWLSLACGSCLGAITLLSLVSAL